MYLINNGSRTSEQRYGITNNERRDILQEIDLEGMGGGGGDPAPELKFGDEGYVLKDGDEGYVAPDNTPTFTDLIKDVENETIKTLAEDKATALITEHKGAGFDKDGNIVDAEGKVVKSFEDYKDTLEADTSDPLEGIEEVEIEGTTYKLNEEGNAVDAEGKVIKTKEEIIASLDESDEGGDDADNHIQFISSLTGFHATDENGEAVEFENTVEGLAARETHIVNQEATKLATQELDSFFNKNPDILDMVNYKKIHGTLVDYGSRKDYTKVTLEDSNDDQHRTIIIEAEMAQGKDETRAKTYADMLISDGKGKAEAEASLKYLTDKQSTDDASALKVQTDKVETAKAEHKVFATNVAEVVKAGKASGFTIPDYFKAKLPDGSHVTLNRDAIFQLITEPTANGQSRYDMMVANDSAEAKVLDAYMRMIGYDFNMLVAQKEASGKVLKLKSAKQKLSGKVKVIKKTGTVLDNELDFGRQ